MPATTISTVLVETPELAGAAGTGIGGQYGCAWFQRMISSRSVIDGGGSSQSVAYGRSGGHPGGLRAFHASTSACELKLAGSAEQSGGAGGNSTGVATDSGGGRYPGCPSNTRRDSLTTAGGGRYVSCPAGR